MRVSWASPHRPVRAGRERPKGDEEAGTVLTPSPAGSRWDSPRPQQALQPERRHDPGRDRKESQGPWPRPVLLGIQSLVRVPESEIACKVTPIFS